MKRVIAFLAAGWLAAGSAHAAWALRGVGTSDGNGTNTALALTLPGGWQVGDIAFIPVGARGAGQTLTASGWSEIVSLLTNRSDKILCRVLESGDTIPPLDWSSSTFQSAVVAVFTGGATTCADIVLHSGTTASAGRTTQPLADATITTDNTLVLFYSAKNKTATSDALTQAPPGGVNELWDSMPAGTAQSAWLGYQIQTTATSITGLSITQGGTTESTQHHAITLSLSSGGAVGGPGAPPVGKVDIELTSIDTDGWIGDFNAQATPDIAVGDTVRIDAKTDGGLDVDYDVDGWLEYLNQPGRVVLHYDVWDDSVGAWMTGGPGKLVFNNQPPECGAPEVMFPRVGEAMDSVDVCSICTDAENDTKTASVTSGTLPTGLALSGTGNCLLGGTATTENETGVAITVTVDDGLGGTGAKDYSIAPLDTITVPNCTSVATDLASCLNDIGSTYLSEGALGYSCHPTVAANDVISTSPAGDAEVDPFTEVAVVFSTGVCGDRPRRSRLGSRRSF